MIEPDKLPESLEITLPVGIPLPLRRILPGEFRMGSRGVLDEEPVHLVKITQPFYLGTFPVTQEQYQAMASLPGLDPEPSLFKNLENSPRRPVEQVSWDDAMALCAKLSGADFFKAALRKGKLNPEEWQIGLPNEAQWEYACRAGTETAYWNGDGEAALAEVGWFDEKWGRGGTHPVGELPANPWGLHDMHGNVWEWCEDVYDPNAYRKRINGWTAAAWSEDDAGKDDEGNENARYRVLRGGSCLSTAWNCRSAFRFRFWPDDRVRFRGFRLCVFPGSGDATSQGPEAKPGAESAAAAVEPRDEAEQAQAEDGASDSQPIDLSKSNFSPRSGDDIF